MKLYAMSLRAWAAFVILVAALIFLSPHTQAANPNWPNPPDQNPRLEPPDDPGFSGAWELWSFIPDEGLDTIRPEEIEMGSGLHADRAWQVTPGGPGGMIAVLDSGILWDEEDLVNKLYINPGETPRPLGAGTYDANGDGIFNVLDYADDPRVRDDDPFLGGNLNGLLDPGDLIGAFSDGADDDGNGYIDDISGWDFLWNDNDPYDDVRDHHGTWESEWSGAEGNNKIGNIGVCPGCPLLQVRVADSFVCNETHFGEGVVFAVASGAAVIQAPLGSFNNTRIAAETVRYAQESGVTVVASAGDETSYHHEYPAAHAGILYVTAIRPDVTNFDKVTSFLNFNNCSNWGERVIFSIPGYMCSSNATGLMSGGAGLLASKAAEDGLDPSLSPNELRQVLISTAYDIDIPGSENDPRLYPSQPGWEENFGYGRPNLRAAVEMIGAGRIPPEASIDGPRWFALLDPTREPTVEVTGKVAARRSLSYSYVLEYGIGASPLDEEFSIVASASGLTEPFDGALGTLDLTAPDFDPTRIPRSAGDFTVTIRLRVTDQDGLCGEDRRAVYVHHDPDALPGFPIDLGVSGEASPKLVDLDGDGVQEIVLATADGLVRAMKGTGELLPGWPVHVELLRSCDPEDPDNHLGAEGFLSGHVDTEMYASIVAAPAIGDLDTDGSPEIVVSTLQGKLWAWDVAGGALPGFPVAMDPEHSSCTWPDMRLERGFFAAPVLVDLDGDADLEIVAAGMDQWMYAWHHDGSRVAGWPVLCRAPIPGGHGARILSTPAAGDINGDGLIDLVVGTNEIYAAFMGRVYAIHGDGNLHPGGPFHEGWPLVTLCPYIHVLPFVGAGTPGSPALADLDGDGTLEIFISSVVGPSFVFNHDLTIYTGLEIFNLFNHSDSYEPIVSVADSSFAIADVDLDGSLDLIAGGAGLRYMLSSMDQGRRTLFDHLLLVWGSRDGKFLRNFPRKVEDWQFLGSVSVADVDGDPKPEIVVGSGGYLLHAMDSRGWESPGWPKFTGGWIIAVPEVGDITGDGRLEVVCVTREGYLFAWRTRGRADQEIQWKGFHHDPRNTGNYHTPLPAQPGPSGLCGALPVSGRDLLGPGIVLCIALLLLGGGTPSVASAFGRGRHRGRPSDKFGVYRNHKHGRRKNEDG